VAQPQPSFAPGTAQVPAAPPPVPAPAGATAPTDNVSSALDYLFNRKPQDGTAAQAVIVVHRKKNIFPKICPSSKR